MKALLFALLVFIVGCATAQQKAEAPKEVIVVCKTHSAILNASRASLSSGSLIKELAKTGECAVYTGKSAYVTTIGETQAIFDNTLCKVHVTTVLIRVGEHIKVRYSFKLYQHAEKEV